MSVRKTCWYPGLVLRVRVECDCPLVFNVEVWLHDGEHRCQAGWEIKKNKNTKNSELVVGKPLYTTFFWEKKQNIYG